MPTAIKRPVGVTILACIYLWIGCFGTLFSPIIALTGGVTSLWRFEAGGAIHSELALRVTGWVFACTWFSLFLAYAIGGFGLWKLRDWARRLFIWINLFFVAAAAVALPIFARPALLAVPLFIGTVPTLAWIIWYLMRPRVRFAFGAYSLPAEGAPNPMPHGLSKMGIAWTVMGMIATFALFFVCIMLVAETMIHASDGYQLGVKRADSSPCVLNALGAPVSAEWLTSGSINESGSDGDADLTISLKGPKGKGKLQLESRKTDGVWEITSMVLVTDSDRIRLVPASPSCQ